MGARLKLTGLITMKVADFTNEHVMTGAGYIVGGIILNVQTKKQTDCSFEGVGDMGPCYDMTSDGNTDPLVLSNGLRISHDDALGGHSVFLAANYPRQNLTSLTDQLQLGELPAFVTKSPSQVGSWTALDLA